MHDNILCVLLRVPPSGGGLSVPLDPFPEATNPRQGNEHKLVKHNRPLIAVLCNFFSFFGEHPFLVKQVLCDG